MDEEGSEKDLHFVSGISGTRSSSHTADVDVPGAVKDPNASASTMMHIARIGGGRAFPLPSGSEVGLAVAKWINTAIQRRAARLGVRGIPDRATPERKIDARKRRRNHGDAKVDGLFIRERARAKLTGSDPQPAEEPQLPRSAAGAIAAASRSSADIKL